MSTVSDGTALRGAGMRRVVAAASAAVAAVALVSACTVDPRPGVVASPSVMVTADQTTTHTVCWDASTAVTYTLASLNANLDAIDLAAASGDQVGLMAAADAIQTQLLRLAAALTGWSNKPIPASVRTALTHGAATLHKICATTYSGNQADIAQQLSAMSRALAGACG
jgi:hypothetical protein